MAHIVYFADFGAQFTRRGPTLLIRACAGIAKKVDHVTDQGTLGSTALRELKRDFNSENKFFVLSYHFWLLGMYEVANKTN